MTIGNYTLAELENIHQFTGECYSSGLLGNLHPDNNPFNPRHKILTTRTTTGRHKRWPYTELIVDKGKEDTLISVGESWTYGDSLAPFVKASETKDNPVYRLMTVFSSLLAHSYDSNLYLWATPADSTSCIFNDLISLLEHLTSQQDPSTLRVVVQMTSPGRDLGHTTLHAKFGLEKFFSTTPNENPILGWSEFHQQHEKNYLDMLANLVNKYGLNPDRVLVWKNFNEFLTPGISKYPFKYIKTPAHRFLCEMSGIPCKLSKSLEVSFYEKAHSLYNLNVSDERLEKEMNIIEKSFEALSKSRLNYWHMNEFGHWVWAGLIKNTFDT